MALKLVNLGFQFSSNLSSSSKLFKDRFVFRSTLVDQISLTESETSLMDDLLGIQGRRGRSSSPQQLNALQVLQRLAGVPDPGTTFVLQKQVEPRQRLLTTISSGKGVEEAIDELISRDQPTGGEDPELEEGEWQMIWNSQTVTDSWIENAASGLMGKQIIGKNGRIKFLVDIFLGLKFSMTGNFAKTGAKTYDVTMYDAAIIGGPFGYPIEMENKFTMELLYSDEKIRISRGYRKILFVHIRTDASKMN